MRVFWGVVVILSALQSGLSAAQQVTIPFNSIHETATLTAQNFKITMSTTTDTLAFNFPPGFPVDQAVCLGQARGSTGQTCQFVAAHQSWVFDQIQKLVMNSGPPNYVTPNSRIIAQVPWGPLSITDFQAGYSYNCIATGNSCSGSFSFNPPTGSAMGSGGLNPNLQ